MREENLREFHFIMTITYPVHNGYSNGTFHGNITVAPGKTRADVYNDLFTMICDKIGVTGPNVLFFSLERNELSAA